MKCTEVLKARVSPEIKGRVQALANHDLLTESAWLKRTVLRELQACDEGHVDKKPLGSGERSGAITRKAGPSTRRSQANDSKSIAQHIDYVTRKGALELETDDGQGLSGRIGKSLVDDWDLDIDEIRPQSDLSATTRRTPKLAHKLMFSMPPGTPPEKVVAAVRNFAREEFWGTHRYAFVLHTDEPHPHVHVGERK